MSRALKYGLGLAFLVLLSGLVYQAYERGSWQERARVLAGRVAVTDSLLRLSQQDGTTYVHAVDSLSQRAQAAHQASLRASRGFQSILDSLKRSQTVLEAPSAPSSTSPASLPADTLRALRIFATKAFEGMLLAKEVIQAKDSEIVDLREIVRLDSGRIAEVLNLQSRLLAERDSARALNKPPSPFALTFEVGAGPGCASNLTQTVCGLSAQVTIFRFRLRG